MMIMKRTVAAKLVVVICVSACKCDYWLPALGREKQYYQPVVAGSWRRYCGRHVPVDGRSEISFMHNNYFCWKGLKDIIK